MTTQNKYIYATTPSIKGYGTDKIVREWLIQGTSCDFDCHTEKVAWLTCNTGTSGWGFHVAVSELSIKETVNV